MTMTVETVRQITGFEPCDKCGHRSYYLAVKDGLELTFCAHHFIDNSPALDAQGFSIYDYTSSLIED